MQAIPKQKRMFLWVIGVLIILNTIYGAVTFIRNPLLIKTVESQTKSELIAAVPIGTPIQLYISTADMYDVETLVGPPWLFDVEAEFFLTLDEFVYHIGEVEVRLEEVPFSDTQANIMKATARFLPPQIEGDLPLYIWSPTDPTSLTTVFVTLHEDALYVFPSGLF